MGLGRMIMLTILRGKWKGFQKKYPKEAQVIRFVLTRIFWLAAYLVKNFGLFVGTVEQIIKLLAGFASLSPSRYDDDLVEEAKTLFNEWQGKIYSGAKKIVDFYEGDWKEIDK
jgi:hypothetical protein